MITIVSGLPRSGTSLMMQMLAAGGMSQLTDFERQPDADNPRGYCEWEPAKLLPKEPNRINEAEGKVVKVISQLLMHVPKGPQYKVVLMERPMGEVLASQDEMMQRRGKSDVLSHDLIARAFTDHLKQFNAWHTRRPDVAILRVSYTRVLQDPESISQEIKSFLNLDLNTEAMVQQVDPSLYRNRRS